MEQDRYKIVANSADWKKHSDARIQISVPAHPCYDGAFHALADWTLERFETVTLCLHDTIQRFNFMVDQLSEEQANEKALANGDAWLKENMIFAKPLIDVIRWDELRFDPLYQNTHRQVTDLYRNNKEFSGAIDCDVDVFAARCIKRGELFNNHRYDLSQQLLLEEVAGYVVMNTKTSATDIHMGMRLTAMPLLMNGLGGFPMKDNALAIVRVFDRHKLPKEVTKESEAA